MLVGTSGLRIRSSSFRQLLPARHPKPPSDEGCRPRVQASLSLEHANSAVHDCAASLN